MIEICMSVKNTSVLIAHGVLPNDTKFEFEPYEFLFPPPSGKIGSSAVRVKGTFSYTAENTIRVVFEGHTNRTYTINLDGCDIRYSEIICLTKLRPNQIMKFCNDLKRLTDLDIIAVNKWSVLYTHAGVFSLSVDHWIAKGVKATQLYPYISLESLEVGERITR